MEVRLVQKLNNKEWDSFVDTSNNGTIFHTLRFLSYHQKDKFKFHNLAFYDKNNLIAVLPGNIEKGVFRSTSGASYGSFVTENVNFAHYEELLNTFLAYAKKEKIKKVFLTPSPIFYLENQNEMERFLLEYKHFKPCSQLITNALNLGIFADEKSIMQKIIKRSKRAIQQSYDNNLIIELNSDFESFYPILLENKKKFNTIPTHSFKEISKLKRLFPKKIKLMMAYDSKRNPVAGILFFICNRRTILTFYIAHYFEFQKLRAVNRLLYELMVWAKREDFQWLDLGVSMDTASMNKMEPSRSLISFKENINTRGFLRTTYCLEVK